MKSYFPKGGNIFPQKRKVFCKAALAIGFYVSFAALTNHLTNKSQKMHKIFSLSLSLIVMLSALTFTACSKDDEGSFINNPSFDTSLLFGTWKVQYWGTTTPSLWDTMKSTKFYFYEDGTFKTTGGYFGSRETNYSISGSTITLNPSASTDNAYVTITVQSISSDTAVFFIKMKVDGETSTLCVKCNKQ